MNGSPAEIFGEGPDGIIGPGGAAPRSGVPTDPAGRAPGREAPADGALVFLRDKSGTHAFGCFAGGGAMLLPDGRAVGLRSKASNRCPGCARAAAYEAMTMLRIDAETNSAPRYVLTLTSREAVTDSKAYQAACAVFWRAFRRRYGQCEYCGFIEWTTGKAATSGGLRRLHSHWLVKLDQALDLDAVQAWVSDEWRKLTGAWVVQLAELRTVGGVVGYLALHHEKMEQAPPPGWTGRRLRPSRGYFAVSGREMRSRARLWLAEHREGQSEYPRPFGAERAARVVWGTTEWEKAAEVVSAEPGRSFDSLPERVALDARLRDPDAPKNVDHLSALAQDEGYHAAVVRSHYRRLWRESLQQAFRSRDDGAAAETTARREGTGDAVT